jgi:Leucine-rich repeat (LRR) protein
VVTSASSSTTDDDAWVTQKGNPWATPSVLGVICNSQKVVTGIYLDGVNAKKHSAFLTPEIGTLLPMLNLLNLDNNNIYGPLPRTLSEVVTLRSLSLAHNHLPGTIPFSSLPLSQLRFLDLSNSLLTGSISEQDYFPRVKFLYLSNNTLTGTLPQSLAGWTNLQVLALDRNQLKGPLVSTLNSLWKLEQVYLESNSFSGTLDGLYANVDPQKPLRLQIFDISSNNLDGSLPSQLFQVPTLRILDLHQNRFGGQLPTIDGEAVIDYVNLKSNQLVGSIPHSWANLKQLTHLDLSFNDMGGVIPATFPALTQLSFLYLTDYEIRHRDQVTKKFDKSFPSVLESMISLRELGLHNTRLTGSIPTWIGLLTNLRVLAIDDNALSGTIPTEMGNLSLMRFLLMEKNNLDGTIPTEFGQMKKLQALLLEVNPGIIGTIHNSSAICVKGLDVFVTDCKTDNQIQPHIVCSCCTHCCDVGYDKTCQSKNYVLVDQDTNWRKGYNNPIVYDFDGQVVVMGTRN